MGLLSRVRVRVGVEVGVGVRVRVRVRVRVGGHVFHPMEGDGVLEVLGRCEA